MLKDNILMKHNDLPITSITDDKLSFKPFVDRVAMGIKKYSRKECFVISIEGEWGIGKTSFLNLVKEELEKEADKFEILHFNPWLITDIEKIASIFLKDLFKIILHQSKKTKKEDMKKDFKKIVSLISPREMNIGLFKWDTKFKEDEKTLFELKEDINKYIKDIGLENKRKIVVIIDDIDRLADDEINLIFRLVKGVADFDNIIYILSFDRQVVANSLCKFHSQNGGKYLDKIIQYPLRMPQSHSITIKDVLAKKINQLLNSLQGEVYYFDEDRWNYVNDDLDKYIKNIRDVNRLFDTFEFEYLSIYNEVNFVDFFIITLIRLFENDLYLLIRDNPPLFRYELLLHYSEYADITNKSSKFNNLTARYGDEEYYNLEVSKIEKILKKYPFIVEHIELIRTIFHTDKKTQVIKSINDSNYFSNYFAMSVSPDTLSYNEFDAYYDMLLEDVEKFDKKQITKQKLEQFYEIYTKYPKAMEDDERVEFIRKLFYFINEYNYYYLFYKVNIFNQLLYNIQYFFYIRLINEEVEKLKDFKKLFFIFDDNNIEIRYCLLLLCCFLEYNIKDANAGMYSDFANINSKQRYAKEIHSQNTDNEIEIYKNKYIEEVKSMNIDKFLKNRYLNALIYFIEYFKIDISHIKVEFEERLFANKSDFFIILKKFIYKNRSFPRKNHPYSISKEVLEKLIDIEKVQKHIDDLKEDSLNGEEEELLNYWNNK